MSHPLRIILTGSNGFLGQKLTELIVTHTEHILVCTSASSNRNWIKNGYEYHQIDFRDENTLLKLIEDFNPTHIIHTAAVSQVERCENNPNLCKLINIETTRTLANICTSLSIHLTFLSTDFVFDGLCGPYSEDDPTKPINEYGKSKLEAESIIQSLCNQAAILRTCLVYGIHGDKSRGNMITLMRQKLLNNEAIHIVNDQWRMPTWVDDLTRATLSAAERNAVGTFHISGNEMMSVFEMAEKIAEKWNLNRSLLFETTAKEIGHDLNRPKRTGFLLEKSFKELDYSPTPFVESLNQIDKQLKGYKYDNI